METCRICKKEKFEEVIDFGSNPLVNSLLTKEECGSEVTYPLVIKQCQSCFLVQNTTPISGKKIYTDQDYLYFSSDMPGLEEYFKEFADDIKERFNTYFVVEIGSNDGIFLKNFEELSRVLGIDPSTNVALRAEKNGIPTVPQFFSERLADQVKNEWGQADVIMGANCIAHLDDLHDLMKGVTNLLSEDGVFIVECNYWGGMVKNKNYALIYHDHFSYFSLINWIDLAKMFGMRVFDAVVTPAQGGSLRVFMCKDQRVTTDRLESLFMDENNMELNALKVVQKYAKDVQAEAKKLGTLVKKLKAEGKTIGGYGAAAKGFSVLKLAGITDEISFFVDDSPAKQGKYTPVTHIPIFAREYVKNPDYFLITAPNYKDAIIEKEEEYLDKGGKFITVEGEIIDGQSKK